MGAVRINGSTSGYVELAAPAVAGSVVMTLPATTGTLAVQGYAYGQSATATVDTSQTTTSTSYADLATVGPTVTLTTGTKALVICYTEQSNSSTQINSTSFAVSGATTIAASDAFRFQINQSVANYIYSGSIVKIVSGLTAGSNTFTVKYKVGGATGTFLNRVISVIDMGS